MTVEITLVTWNAMNLFDSAHPQQAKPKRELQPMAYVLDGLQAGIVALQEVGSLTALEELNDRLKTPFAHLGLLPGNSARHIHLGFMSHWPFTLSSHADRVLTDEHGQVLQEYRSKADAQADTPSALRFQRDLLLAEFEIGTAPRLAVFNTHLKSRNTSRWHRHPTETIRLAEARKAARIVTAFKHDHPRHAVVVAGDFNEGCEHPSVQPLVTLPDFSDPVLDELVPANRQLSTYWSRDRERIDYLLLCDVARRAYVAGSAVVSISAAVRKASDHAPVSIRLHL